MMTDSETSKRKNDDQMPEPKRSQWKMTLLTVICGIILFILTTGLLMLLIMYVARAAFGGQS